MATAPEIIAFDDADLFMSETTDPFAQLKQDLYHRLIEDPGSNLDDPDRGLGLLNMLSGVVDPDLGARIENELKKDRRAVTASATLTESKPGVYDIAIAIQTNDGALGILIRSNGTTIAMVG